MTEIICFVLGAIFALLIIHKKPEAEEKTEGTVETKEEDEDDRILSPMTLRNGYGVTRDKKPTFAEQWVNIINYSGESQLEGDYEENERNNPREHLE